MKRLLYIHIFLFIILTASFLIAQEKMWVSSAKAKLKAGRKASSETIMKLAMGTELTVLDRERRWIQVRVLSGEEGWVYKGRLSQTPPQKESQDETSTLLSGMFGSEIQADEADTSRSIRGLSSETEQYARNRGTPLSYRQALDQVLSRSVTEKELEDFLKWGQVGEYARE